MTIDQALQQAIEEAMRDLDAASCLVEETHDAWQRARKAERDAELAWGNAINLQSAAVKALLAARREAGA